jgi:predicted TIM-barrel fold metal-dependent hydrolase
MAIVVHARSTISKNRPYGAKQARIFIEQLLPEAPDITVQIAHLAGSGGYDDPTVDEALGVYIEYIGKKDARMKNVYFDVSGVAGPGDWKSHATQIVKRMREIGLERLVYGSDAPVPGNLPKEAYQRWRELPLTEAEFTRVEKNVAPYFR